jgi:peptidoglycan/xylan/chitin deacetylase (PgdA/CDA1 family)
LGAFLRHAAKTVAVRVGKRTLFRKNASRVVALCYHSVHPSKAFGKPPALFDAHLAWLAEHCDVVPFGEILMAARGARAGRPVVAITFDDGFADNYEYAFPLLRQHRLPATFFLTVGLMERDPAVMARFRELFQAGDEDLRPLTWVNVREMRRSGMEFGAHTYGHPNLARLARARAEGELTRSRQLMEDRIGERVTSMAYPFGTPGRAFTRETLEIARGAGYEHAATVTFRAVRPADSPLAIPRFSSLRRSVESLKDMVFGAWDLVGLWQERTPLALQKLVSARSD